MAVSHIRPPIKFIHFARGAPHARMCLITANDGLAIQPAPPPLLLPPDSLRGHSDITWRGYTRPSHTTRNRGPLYCYTWNLLQEETTRLTDIIHGRFMSGEKWELSHPIHTYCPEVTTPIWKHIEGTHPSSRHMRTFIRNSHVVYGCIPIIMIYGVIRQ
jgi:hypothetical protein